jgi:CelD/BcsL family acetyltransferase involved in cellulose biosynthesis
LDLAPDIRGVILLTMSIALSPITFDQLTVNWQEPRESFYTPHPFVTPHWLEAWWKSFGADDELFLRAVIRDGELIGVAPLRIHEHVARFIGSADVCDYLDFIVKPGAEEDFFKAVLDGLKGLNIQTLELECLRPDSTVIKHLIPSLQRVGGVVEVTDTDVTLEMQLPVSWDAYLLSLTTHQRHEIGRKLRRLEESGAIRFDIKPPREVESDLSTLIRLLRLSRADKAEFMTQKMENFFKQLAESMRRAGLLRFGHLQLGDTVVASVMCFDYNGTRYLYNSGYDPQFSSLSVGLLSKVYSIKDAIEQKMTVYDYLKGAEIYKYHLGGFELPISRARIEFAR